VKKTVDHDAREAFCNATRTPLEHARRIARFADRLLDELAPIHGITKTWRPWVHSGALLRAVVSTVPRLNIDRLIREHNDLLPDAPRSGRTILRQALAMANPSGKPPVPSPSMPTTRRDAGRMLASRIATLITLVPVAPDDPRTGFPKLLAVRDTGDSVNLVLDRPNAFLVESLRRNSGLWMRILNRRVTIAVCRDGKPLPDPPVLLPSDSLEFAAGKILMDQLQRFTSRQYGLLLRDDPEFVHELRVGTRQMRAALEVFGPALGAWARKARSSMAEIATGLGAVRDADVFCIFLQKSMKQCPKQQVSFIRDMEQCARNRAGENLRALIPLVQEPGHDRLLVALRRHLKQCLHLPATGAGTRSGNGGTPLANAAPHLLKKRLKATLKYPCSLSDCSPEQLHELRIACKRLRYTAEFLSPVYPEGLRKLIRTATRMQTFLGDVHDANVYKETIRLYRRRRRKTSSVQADDSAVRHLYARLDTWHDGRLDKAEAIWKRFTTTKEKKSIMAAILPVTS